MLPIQKKTDKPVWLLVDVSILKLTIVTTARKQN